MKYLIVKSISLALIMAILLACNEKKGELAATAIDKEQIKQEIQAKEDAFAELYNKGELKDIGYYAEDATTFFQNRPPLVGKQAIVDFLKNDIISNTDKISFKTKEVFVSGDGNMVVEIGYFKVVDSADALLNSGNYMSLFEKRNGKYVAVRDMSASDIPVK